MAGERILIVDDKNEVTEFCEKYLFQPHGYTSLVAHSGREGFEIALREAPDLMILDFKLPEMSGLEVLRALRERQADIPIIFMTAFGSDEDIVTAFRLGVKDYFTKPFDAGEMIAAVERLLAERRQQEEQNRRQRELERQIKRLSTLYGSSVESVLNHIVEAAVAITAAEEGYLLLLDEETDELYMCSAMNVGQRFASGFRLKVQDTIAGRVVKLGEPVRYNHIDHHNLFKIKTGYLVQALINVPLRDGDKIIGVLGVDNKTSSETFSRTDLELLMALGDHAVSSITNASQYEQIHHALTRRVQELAVVQQLAQDLNPVVDIERIARVTLHHSMRVTGAESGLVGLRLKGQPEWIAEGYLAVAMREEIWRPNWDAGVIEQAVKQVEPKLLDDLQGSFDAVHVLPQTRSQLVVPIRRGEQVLGVIDLESSMPAAFSAELPQLLLALADRAAVAIENAQLFDLVMDEQRRTKLVLQSIADGLCTVDLDLRIRSFNPAAERITGWSAAEAHGQLSATVFCDADHPEASHQCQLIQEAMNGGRSVASSQSDPPVQGRGGRQIFLSSSVAPIYSHEGRLEGAVVAFRDVSSERELDRLKSDFVSMISHELRSPLANLSAAIELMLQLTEGQDEVQQTLAIARANERRLTRLVEDILSVSRIDAGQMKVHQEPVTLIPILRRAVRIAQDQTKQHRITLQASPAVPFVIADQSKVEIIISNLITNAVNYSPEGGRILVKVVGPQNGEMIVSVIDEGVGIAADHLEKIFDRFYRVDTSDGRKVYGHGLGLYISKCLIELQGGRIWVDSKEGYGSCFSFSLPIVEQEQVQSYTLATFQ